MKWRIVFIALGMVLIMMAPAPAAEQYRWIDRNRTVHLNFNVPPEPGPLRPVVRRPAPSPAPRPKKVGGAEPARPIVPKPGPEKPAEPGTTPKPDPLLSPAFTLKPNLTPQIFEKYEPAVN